MNNKNLSSLLIVVLAVVLGARMSEALVYRLADDPTLADQADVIVHGRVVDRAVVDRDGKIVTIYVVAPHDVIKGVIVNSTFGVEVLGGELPDGRFLHLFGTPSFVLEQEVLLFLRAGDDGRFRVLHVFQGAFEALVTDGGTSWSRPIDEMARQVPVKNGGAYPNTGQVRDGGLFVAWLHDRVVGARRAPDYYVTAGVTANPIEKFNLLGGRNAPPFWRWFRFDDGERLLWRRHEDGQAGSSDGGASAFAAARRAWNSEPNTPVRLRDGGTTASRAGFSASDGQNTIMFQDFNGLFDTAFSCQTGGTLAIGGVRGRSNAPIIQWKGEPFREPFEADIVINTGVECRADDNTLLGELFAHELGHTLGLGHSCDSAGAPPCGSNPRLAEALMRPSATPPILGAVLRVDDVDGIRFLYQPVGVGCMLTNGGGQYCSDPDCGPCGAGEGDCDGDGECQASLICGENNGADFGFPPGIDVCVGGSGCNETLGSARYCSDPACGPCAAGEGDCDSDAECAVGLSCVDNIGADFGFPPGIDVCVGDVPPPPTGECMLQPGNGRFCSDPNCGPCSSGEGDCDNDAECAGSLTCGTNNGADFGFPPGVDVCIGDGTCSATLGTGPYCATPGCGPCGEGQGDCDNDDECAAGLTCVDNIGADFGFPPGVDVCTGAIP